MTESMRKPSLAWTLFLLVLLTTQIQENEAGSIKFKKLLKKVLLLRALAGKKLTIIPIPIPLNLLLKEMDKMPKMPPPQMPYPMYMPHAAGKMMSPEMMMMMPKVSDIMMGQHPEMMMPQKENAMMASASYGMLRGV